MPAFVAGGPHGSAYFATSSEALAWLLAELVPGEAGVVTKFDGTTTEAVVVRTAGGYRIYTE